MLLLLLLLLIYLSSTYINIMSMIIWGIGSFNWQEELFTFPSPLPPPTPPPSSFILYQTLYS